MSVSGSDLTKAITKGIRAPGQYLTCYLGDSGMAFIFRLKNSPARQKVCKTCQKPCIFTQIFHSIMHVLSGFFFFFWPHFQYIRAHGPNPSFPSSTGRALKHILQSWGVTKAYAQRWEHACMFPFLVLPAALTRAALVLIQLLSMLPPQGRRQHGKAVLLELVLQIAQ